MKLKTFGDLNKEILEVSNFYNIIFNADHKNDLHAHNSYEIMLCKEGSLIFEHLDDKKNKIVTTLFKGQFVLVNAGVYHSVRLTEKSWILNLEFVPLESNQPDKLTINCAELFGLNDVLKSIKSKNLPYYVFEDLANVEYEIIRFVDEMTNLSEGNEKTLVCKLRLLSVLMAVSRCTIYEINNKIGIIHVRKALEFINEKFKENINVNQVAEYCGVNADYLQRLVKKAIGKNLIHIINECRIKYAKLLLVSRKELNMDEIAQLCGYSGRLSLNYEFKKIIGLSAADYKKNSSLRHVRSKDLLPLRRVQEYFVGISKLDET